MRERQGTNITFLRPQRSTFQRRVHGVKKKKKGTSKRNGVRESYCGAHLPVLALKSGQLAAEKAFVRQKICMWDMHCASWAIPTFSLEQRTPNGIYHIPIEWSHCPPKTRNRVWKYLLTLNGIHCTGSLMFKSKWQLPTCHAICISEKQVLSHYVTDSLEGFPLLKTFMSAMPLQWHVGGLRNNSGSSHLSDF